MTPAEKLARRKPRRDSGPLVCQIRSLRNDLGLSTQDVAGAAKVSAANLNRIERGGDVGMLIALRLARLFGKSIEVIWKER